MSAQGTSLRFVDKNHPINLFGPALAATSTTPWISLANYNHISFVFLYKNTTTVTGSAITFLQAQDVAGTGSKAFTPVTVWTDIDEATADALVAAAVVSGTFTLDATNSKLGIAVIEVDASELDQANNFMAISAAMATSVAQVLTVLAVMTGARVGGGVGHFPSALT